MQASQSQTRFLRAYGSVLGHGEPIRFNKADRFQFEFRDSCLDELVSEERPVRLVWSLRTLASAAKPGDLNIKT